MMPRRCHVISMNSVTDLLLLCKIGSGRISKLKSVKMYTTEKQPFEDVSPIENRVFPLSC